MRRSVTDARRIWNINMSSGGRQAYWQANALH
jgi:hypothetical protein